jgi:TonB family protein
MLSRITWIFLLLCGSTALPNAAQAPKASKAEQNAAAVRLVHSLELSPLTEDAKKNRKRLERWLEKLPDIEVPSCSNFFKTGEPKPKYTSELMLQLKLSYAAFMIEHSDQADHPEARTRAGIIGLLKAYESFRESSPEARSEFLDTLFEQQKKDVLSAPSIREVMARCSQVPLSDRNRRSSDAGDMVYASIEVSTPARIKSKPVPQYPDEAKAHRIEGVVVLQAVLSSSGRITDIQILEGLPYGLTEQSIAAARRIRFEPAIKDSRPVSTLVKLEYHFGLF